MGTWVRVLNNTYKRVNLPTPHWTGSVEWDLGCWIYAIAVNPRNKRKFAKVFYRQPGWVGPLWVEVENDGYINYCRSAGCKPIDIK